MTIGILERMTDEKQALALEKSWAYEIIDYTFWILLEGSVPFDARMAYVQRNPDVLKQSQKESDAYCERVRILRSGEHCLNYCRTPIPLTRGGRIAALPTGRSLIIFSLITRRLLTNTVL